MKLLLALILVSLALAPLAQADPQTLIFLDSQPGDYIGQGMQATFTPADGSFTVSGSTSGITVSFFGSGFGLFWFLDFAPPTGQSIARSEYEGAQRYAFHAPPKPGLDVSGDGRGCNTVAGRFLVSEVAFNPDNTVARFAVDFEQHCEGATPALYGSVRYNSSVPVTPRFGIGDASALKGNVGTSDASVTLALSLLSDHPVSVNYATADGTAVAGTDYVATSGAVTLQPGTTSQTITVPVIGDRLSRGSKTFKVQLSSPTGAPLGDASANVKIFDPNSPITALSMSSQPGDFIGGGQLFLFNISDGLFTPSRNFDNGVSVSIQTGDFWTLDFAAPDSQTLVPGTYDNAQRFPFQPPGVPGLSVSGQGRGCNTLTGRFVVTQAVYDGSGNVKKFSSDFEQHCEGAAPALFGSLRINSSLRQVSVSNAVIDAGNSTATFTVTLNPASSTNVSVRFSTADGTAIGNVDYTRTAQTVTFAPGEIEHTVVVPLLTSGTGDKTFYGQLTQPKGSPLWIRQGTAVF